MSLNKEDSPPITNPRNAQTQRAYTQPPLNPNRWIPDAGNDTVLQAPVRATPPSHAQRIENQRTQGGNERA